MSGGKSPGGPVRSSPLTLSAGLAREQSELKTLLFQLTSKLLGEQEEWLREQLSDWPEDGCAETCHAIFPYLNAALTGVCDRRKLHIRRGYFDTTELSENNPRSPYGDHWEKNHTWITQGDIVIDPTASQFLTYLPSTLLVVDQQDPEYGFYRQGR